MKSARAGFALLETVLAMGLGLTVAAASAALFVAGSKTFLRMSKQTTLMGDARQALEGRTQSEGLLRRSRAAMALTELTSSAITLQAADGTTRRFVASNNRLTYTSGSASQLLGSNIQSFAVNGYQIGGNGLIQLSTSAAAATLVTVYFESPEGSARHPVLGAARLRNR